MSNRHYPTLAQAFRLLATTTMRPFTKLDWQMFSGCETTDPLIGESGPYLLVLDGETLLLLAQADCGGGQTYHA